MPEQNKPSSPDQGTVPSKSALKRRMQALQELGEQLVNLSDKQLRKIPIEDERLREAVHQARNIRSHSARRRHLQLIGKLMRDIDAQPIEHALQNMDNEHRARVDDFHRLEHLRDEVLAAGPNGVELIMQRWPNADRQQLRQLLRQHGRESSAGKPPVASRKLFRIIRELAEHQGSGT